MKISSLESFKEEINKIREYFKHIQYTNEIIFYTLIETDSKQLQDSLDKLQHHHRIFRTDKKIFEYKASIISLYGLLEKYVEIWIKEYLELLPNLVCDYNQIDEKIRNNHFELSLKLITTMISRESSKHQHLIKEKVLENLYQCNSNTLGYNFNTEAFVLSSGNLKHKQIVKLFDSISIDLNKSLKNNEILIQYIKERNQAVNVLNLETDNLYNKINDLVERRNQIAHGSEILDILNVSELDDYIEFLENYCQAIFETLEKEFIEKESIHTFQKIEKVLEIFNHKILAFEIEEYTIKAGDMLIIQTSAGNFHKKPILTIQLDNISYKELTTKEKIAIAISVNYRIKENQTFYLLKRA